MNSIEKKSFIEVIIFLLLGVLIKKMDQSFDFGLYMIGGILYQVLLIKNWIREVGHE